MAAPFLDEALADEIFAPSNAEEAAQLREMLADLEADVAPRLAALRAMGGASTSDSKAAQRELHTLRGPVSNFGFARSAERLAALESSWPELGAAERSRELEAAEADLRAGLQAMRARYPGLRG